MISNTETYANITVGIKTFNRHETLERSLESLKGHPFKKVVVADDGDRTSNKDALYDRYSRVLPLEVIYLPQDTGLAAGRNALVSASDTDYILILDDDEAIPKNILDLTRILEFDPTLGGISGYWLEHGFIRCNARDLLIKDGYLLQDIPAPKPARHFEELEYYIYEFIPNSTMFRRKCLLDYPWDNFYKIGSEHEDFYLGQKTSTDWKFAVTPNVTIDHFPLKAKSSYNVKYRKNNARLELSAEYLHKKWQFEATLFGTQHVEHPMRSIRNRERTIHTLIQRNIKLSRVAQIQQAFIPLKLYWFI